MNRQEKLRFYKSKAWKNKRKEIIKRDRNECQHCKAQGKVITGQMVNLEVHHIKHLEDRFDLRLNSDNLITLCPSCHNKQHPEKQLKLIKQKPHAPRWE